MTRGLNSFLKDILELAVEMKAPASIREISKGLGDMESFVASAVHTLEVLGLMEMPEDGRFVISQKGLEYMSMSEAEQRIYETENPFILYRDVDGSVTTAKPAGWDIEE